jgi:hypothetical protein
MRTSIVSDRVVGQFPISIATSLALEGAIGIYPEKETGINLLKDYREIWVNVKTIFRNLYNACDRASVLNTPVEDFVEGMNTDMEHFANVIRDQTQSMTHVVFYICDYANMTLHYPYAHIRGDTTDLQKAYTEAMKKVLQGVLDQQYFEIKLYSHSITDSSSQKLLLLTHFPLDLFAKGLTNKELLESHTGIIKPSHQWYTKYLNGKELPNIPFRKDLMQVFGDQEHFRPMSIGIRKQLLQIAEQYNWSQVTTTTKIKYGIEQLKDPLVKDILSKIITNQ